MVEFTEYLADILWFSADGISESWAKPGPGLLLRLPQGSPWIGALAPSRVWLQLVHILNREMTIVMKKKFF